MTSTQFAILATAALVLGSAAPRAAGQNLDYETFKTKVEPIFLKKRPGHARCVACHSANNSAFRLETPGEDGTWTDAQSHTNFDNVRNLVKPGDPESSRLLKHPLAPEAGGDSFHNGGRQFTSKNDPEWQTIADWVRAAK
jgi:hypothetical protein